METGWALGRPPFGDFQGSSVCQHPLSACYLRTGAELRSQRRVRSGSASQKAAFFTNLPSSGSGSRQHMRSSEELLKNMNATVPLRMIKSESFGEGLGKVQLWLGAHC